MVWEKWVSGFTPVLYWTVSLPVWHNIVHLCVCIYIYMDVYVWVSVSVRVWVTKEGKFSLISLTSVGKSVTFVGYFDANTTQRAGHALTCKTGSGGRKRRRTLVSYEWDSGSKRVTQLGQRRRQRWVSWSQKAAQGKWKSGKSETGLWAVKTMTRGESASLVAV